MLSVYVYTCTFILYTEQSVRTVTELFGEACSSYTELRPQVIVRTTV
jgi:hypothetical protein